MVTLRGLVGTTGKGYLQRDGRDVLFSDKVVLTKGTFDAFDASKYLRAAGIDVMGLEDGRVYGVSFKKGSGRWYNGIELKGDECLVRNILSAHLARYKIYKKSKESFLVRQVRISKTFSWDGALLTELCKKDNRTSFVNKSFHDYVVETTGADNFFVVNNRIAVYRCDDDPVGCVGIFWPC
jgi:hypothetical protein